MAKSIEPVIESFLNGKSKKISNTETDGTSLWLFGNKIAEKGVDGLYINTCNWNSRTTRDRLSMLPDVWVSSKKGQLFLKVGNNDWQKWDGKLINVTEILEKC